MQPEERDPKQPEMTRAEWREHRANRYPQQSELQRPDRHWMPEDTIVYGNKDAIATLSKRVAKQERNVCRKTLKAWGKEIRYRVKNAKRSPNDFANDFWLWSAAHPPTAEARTWLAPPDLLLLQYERWLESILTQRIESLDDGSEGG